MKKLLWLLLLGSAVAQTTHPLKTTVSPNTTLSAGGGTAPAALVTSTVQSLGTNGGTTTGINTTGANLIDVCVSRTAGVAGTLTDSKGNSYASALTRSDVSSGTVAIDRYSLYSPTVGASHTFTVTGTGVTAAIAVKAFSGMLVNGIDRQTGFTDTSSRTQITPTPITPSVDKEIAVSCVSSDGPGGTTYKIDSGFTDVTQIADGVGAFFAIAGAYLPQYTAALLNPTSWWTNTAGNEATDIISYVTNASPSPSCVSCTYEQSTGSAGAAYLLTRLLMSPMFSLVNCYLPSAFIPTGAGVEPQP
jgi:hypothetical protein